MSGEYRQIMSKSEFLSHGGYDKEQYEGLLVSSMPDGSGYQIGIQLSEDKVMKVDEVSEENVRDKVYEWAPQVPVIQYQHKAEKPDIQNYDGLQ
ncbi:MAG: hypothetical protein ACM3QZ_11550 [Solirubrobacterales bacterium]